MERELTVNLGERSYPIVIGKNLRERLREEVMALKEAGHPLAVVSDASVHGAQESFFHAVFEGIPHLSLPAGESTKSIRHLEQAYDFLSGVPLDRSGYVFAFGGGVIGDLTGFAAASYLRGIAFSMIPTTLLSMVDSSVGGKTGINLKQGKNLVGAFHQPAGVSIDVELLQTLPTREFNAGMGEVIKYGMLGNPELFRQLEGEPVLTPECHSLPQVIETCCRQKVEVVQADEREQAGMNGRALLNLGHTFAHAIETVAGYGGYLHGEAVAVGLILAARLSVELGWIEAGETERVETLLRRYNLPVALFKPLDENALMEVMLRDKKVRQGRIRLVAMREIGEAVTVDSVPEKLIREIWKTANSAREPGS